MTPSVAALVAVLSLAGPAASGPVDPVVASRKAFLAARLAIADGRYQEALALYRQVLTVLPNDAIVHLEYAQLLRDLNVGEEATGMSAAVGGGATQGARPVRAPRGTALSARGAAR